MTPQLLIETLSPAAAMLVESEDAAKNYYLSGIMMMADIKNGNGRVYGLNEISREVERATKRLSEGYSICGELNHPDNLSIDLNNVSHSITELRMDGNNAVGKCKLLNTPKGQIARAILEGGVRLGVSSRGTGNVNESGSVSDFQFVTVDIVSQPSAPEAYPDLIRESLGEKKIMSLAEAVVHDSAAQKYFKQEMNKFINSILRK